MLEHSHQGGLHVFTLNAQARRNAWDSATRAELAAFLRAGATDPGVRAVVLTGAGKEAFCAGADLKDPDLGVPGTAQARMDAFSDFYRALLTFPKPLVAALNGVAAGSALQAVLMMDARIGHAGVRLGMPEVVSGIPCITGTTILAWALGGTRARELVLSGRFLPAGEALGLGLIDRLVQAEAVLDEACAEAERLSALPPIAYAQTKLWAHAPLIQSLAGAFRRAIEVRLDEDVSHGIRDGVARFVHGGAHP